MLPAEQSAQYAFAMRHSPAPLAFTAENFHFNSLFRGQAVSDTNPARNSCGQPLKETAMSQKSDQDNHANQLNPNHDSYWESRGYDERPEDWEDRI